MKKRGPPATGKGTPILVRLQPDLLSEVDSWIGIRHGKYLTRPEAIRRLVEFALKRDPARMPVLVGRRSAKGAAKASRLASDVIDGLADKSAPSEEQEKRKRRLLKGPPEFRELRAPKGKR